MSAGTDRITFRCSAERQSAMHRAIARHNANPGQRDSLNVTSFLLRAIDEKIAHLDRSRKKIKRAKRIAGKVPVDQCGNPIAKSDPDYAEWVRIHGGPN
jgi:hypothetical protein